jgi:uroporphyrinogen decarboxylase
MNFRESLKATLNWERPTDICMFEPGYWPETIARWRNEGLGAGQQPWEALDNITVYRRVPVNARWCPPFADELISREGNHKIIRNGEGATLEVFTDHTAFPRFIKHAVENIADFEAIKERLNPHTPERFPADWPSIVKEVNARKYVLCMGALEISFFGWHRDLMGVENLLMAYFDQPELVHAISRQHLQFLKELYTPIMKEVDFDFIFMWEDMAFKNGPLISPALFREFQLPYVKELISYFKCIRDYKVIVDCDGDMTKLIPLWMEGGVDGLLPFECAAGMDIRQIAHDFPKLLISGGLDKRELAKGKKAIDKELEAKLPIMFKRGGYLPTMDHHVPPDVSFDDFKYYVSRVHEIYHRCR